MEGDFPGWDYTITKPVGETVATVSKELLQWTDTYVLDIVDPADALHVLMFVLAIDAESALQNEIELARLCGSARMAGLFTLHGLGNSGIIKKYDKT